MTAKDTWNIPTTRIYAVPLRNMSCVQAKRHYRHTCAEYTQGFPIVSPMVEFSKGDPEQAQSGDWTQFMSAFRFLMRQATLGKPWNTPHLPLLFQSIVL